MYTDHVPVHDINLRLPESRRWAEVINAERATARRLLRSARPDLPMAARLVASAVGSLLSGAYMLAGGRYRDEVTAWADGLDVPANDLLLLNCSYELSHAWDRMQTFGCTAGVRWVPSVGLVHVRSMDWPIAQIGAATRLFRFRDGRRRFTSVGILGHVGVLSGMVPGAYSVTLNWAPPVQLPRFQWGPAFLLREVLETCPTYDEAVAALADAEMSTSVFYLVAGTKRGQACVIERTQDESAIREMTGDVLVQANHHVARRMLRHNDVISEGSEHEYSLLETSQERGEVLDRELRRASTATDIASVAACLDVEPVCNEESFQQMAFCPRTGEVKAWRWVRGSAHLR